MSVITGIGVDLVGISRFERSVKRSPQLLERLFTARERTLPVRSLAARFAAKEALSKALGGPEGLRWTEIDVVVAASARPSFALTGATAETVARLGITDIHLSITRDGDVAVACVVSQTADGAIKPA